MKLFEIWKEGFAATGEHETAVLLAKVEADSFDQAVAKYIKDQKESFYPDSVKDYSKSDHGHSIWGCYLYDNETDARKGFG